MEQNVKKKKGKGCLIAIGVIFGLIIIISLIGGGGDKKDSANQNTEQVSQVEENKEKQNPIAVTAKEIAKTFEANELKGKEMYTGKYAAITGTVDSINEMLGQKFVVLEGNGIVGIQCFFDSDKEKELANLSKGQKITILGTIGEMAVNVDVSDCEIQK